MRRPAAAASSHEGQEVDDRIIFLGKVNVEDPFSIIEIDYQGNVTNEIQLALGSQDYSPERMIRGDNDTYYLLVNDYYNWRQHFIKVDSDGSIIWNILLGGYLTMNYDRMAMFGDGKIVLGNWPHITAYDSSGTQCWNTSLGVLNSWASGQQPIIQGNELIIIADYLTNWEFSGRNIMKYNSEGDLLWNVSVGARHPTGSDADLKISGLDVSENKTYGLVEIDGTLHNPYMFQLSNSGELDNYWTLDYFVLGSYYLHLNREGAPVVFAINRTATDTKYLVALTYPSVIPQETGGSDSITTTVTGNDDEVMIQRTIGLILIGLGSVTIVAVLVLYLKKIRGS